MGDPGFEGKDPNFRQVGVRKDGRLMMGNAHTHHSHGSSSSIPSKFETILYAGDSEVDGFGTRQTRFKYIHQDLPGPGTYESKNDGSLEFQSDSLSKKGYGNGFVSKTDRWYRAGEKRVTYFPGPGAYKDTTFLQEKARNNFNYSETTAPFKATNSAAIVPTDEQVPGPGTYNPTALDRKRNSRPMRYPRGHPNRPRSSSSQRPESGNQRPRSGSTNKRFESETHQSFMTTAPRFHGNYKDNKLPPPGAYNVDGSSQWTAEDVPSAAFASQSNRKGFEGLTPGDPGPGNYDMYYAEDLRKAEIKAADQPNFRESNNTKFGVPKQYRKAPDNYPGAGAYDPHKEYFDSTKRKGFFGSSTKSPRGKIGTSVGFSNATRQRANRGEARLMQTTASISSGLQRDIIAQTQIRPPGPAYYKPDANGAREKRSFHLNTQSRWIGP